MFGPSQVIFFWSFFVLQCFEDLVELPSSEDIANFGKEQEPKYVEKVMYYFPDANILRSGSTAEDKYRNLHWWYDLCAWTSCIHCQTDSLFPDFIHSPEHFYYKCHMAQIKH